MKTEEELIWESYEQSNLNWFYHGGAKWEKYNAEVKQPKKGRYEAGAGIYLTNSYETARKYAKGSKIVSKVGINKDIKFAHSVKIPKEHIIAFLKTYVGPKYRNQIISDLDRVGGDLYPANYLINLSINYEVGGRNAIAIKDFLVEHGVDASLYKQSGDEVWVVVHNTKIIQKVIHTKPSDVSVDDYMLNVDI